MLDLRYSSKFKKDFKVCIKRKYKMELLMQIIDVLRIPDSLPTKNSDHSLSGNYAGVQRMSYCSGLAFDLPSKG